MKYNKWDFSKNEKIYVACPAYAKSGGPELLHQLAYEISKYRKCYIYYYNSRLKVPIPQGYEKYVSNYVTHIPYKDINKQNIIIIPEVATELLYRFSEMNCVLWWLSIDNFKSSEKNFLDVIIREYGRRKFSFYRFRNKCLHLVQSYYAKKYLVQHGINKKDIQFLSDYINTDFYNLSTSKRNNIVLYNPKKGMEFTKKIISASKGLKFIPIINMTNMEIIELMQKSKVYIDFGNHPGKDRLPREAALQGLCIITGRNGAANNNIDIPIPNNFKIKAKEKNIPQVINKIEECLDNYDENKKMFLPYIESILNEKLIFEDSVKQLFGGK